MFRIKNVWLKLKKMSWIQVIPFHKLLHFPTHKHDQVYFLLGYYSCYTVNYLFFVLIISEENVYFSESSILIIFEIVTVR